MKKLLAVAVAAASMVPFAMPSEAAKCTRLAGQGVGITNVLATENSKMAVANAASSKGLKLKGKASTSCKYEGIVSTCVTKQSACK